VVPLDHTAEQQGFNLLGYLRDYFSNYQLSLLTVKKSWAEKNRQLWVRYLTATVRTHRWVFANKEAAIDFLAKEIPLKPEMARRGWEYYTANRIWHPNAEKRLKTLDQLMDTYSKTVGRGAQLVLGLAPDSRGLMPEVDVARLKEFGDEVKRVYGASVGSATPEGVLFSPPARIDRIVLREDLTHGQRVRTFKVRVRTGGVWKEVGQGTTIGHKRIVQFEPVLAQEVRLSVEASLEEPRLLKVSAHYGGR